MSVLGLTEAEAYDWDSMSPDLCQAQTVFNRAEWMDTILNALRAFCHSVGETSDSKALCSRFIFHRSFASTPLPDLLKGNGEMLAFKSTRQLLAYLSRLEKKVYDYVLGKIGGIEVISFLRDFFKLENNTLVAHIERFLKEKSLNESVIGKKVVNERTIGPVTCEQIVDSFHYLYTRKKKIYAFTLNGKPVHFVSQKSKDRAQRQIGFFTQLIQVLNEALHVGAPFASIEPQLLLREGGASAAEIPSLPLLQALSEQVNDHGRVLLEERFFPQLFSAGPGIPRLEKNLEWSPVYEIFARQDGSFSVTRYRLYDFVRDDQKLGVVNMRWRVTGSLNSSSYLGVLECEEFCLYPQEDVSMETGASLLKLYPLLSLDDS
ncbi:MAG: hypothetical protein S4CHLAM2_09910 [Chlamydiales bacterium]|nr:hypothetical protein [Chlamydiales bacterium]